MTRISRYNHFQQWRDGYYIAYNAYSGAVALMTAENYETYCRLTETMNSANGESSLTASEQELLKQLEYGRFVVAAGRDEFAAVKLQHGLDRYDQTTLGLVIAPTMACNMACEYCFEENKKGKMSPEIVEAIITFVDKQARYLKHVDVNWYGGEPLLALDVIEDLTLTLLDLGKEKDFQYSASMISNGYLLTKEVVDKLVELKVSMIQVTVDGPARIHNKKRPLKNGKESFQTILDNIAYAASKLMITVRVNVDKGFDAGVIGELLEELKRAGVQDRVAVYFGQLEPATKVCSNIADTCYDTCDFSRVEADYYRLLLDDGFRIEKLPSPTSAFCMAQRISAFLIDPDGNLYRCFNYVGDPAMAMGNIRDAIDYSHVNFQRLFDFNPFEDESCKNCDILPICMGGCPAQRADRDLSHEQLCLGWRHNLSPMLEIIARSRQQKAKSAIKEQQ
jgi:uncharacterized protein